jgi:hypothetical protein
MVLFHQLGMEVQKVYEVPLPDSMKSSVFWDITPCSPLKANRRFGGTCRLHLQGRRISRSRNQRESRWQACPEDRNFHSHRCENLKSYIGSMRLPDGGLNLHSPEYIALVTTTTPPRSINSRESLGLWTGKTENSIRNSITVVL